MICVTVFKNIWQCTVRLVNNDPRIRFEFKSKIWDRDQRNTTVWLYYSAYRCNLPVFRYIWGQTCNEQEGCWRVGSERRLWFSWSPNDTSAIPRRLIVAVEAPKDSLPRGVDIQWKLHRKAFNMKSPILSDDYCRSDDNDVPLSYSGMKLVFWWSVSVVRFTAAEDEARNVRGRCKNNSHPNSRVP